MTADRYTVASISGYRYMHDSRYPASNTNSGNCRAITTWYVYDRFHGYRVVAAFDNRRRFSVIGNTLIPAELLARSKARKLNRQWRRRQPGLA